MEKGPWTEIIYMDKLLSNRQLALLAPESAIVMTILIDVCCVFKCIDCCCKVSLIQMLHLVSEVRKHGSRYSK